MTDSAQPAGGPVINMIRLGNLANGMIQFMVMNALAAKAPGCRLSNVQLPEWGVDLPFIPGDENRHAVISGHRIDLDGIAAQIRDGRLTRVDFQAYAVRLENFPDRDACARLFRSDLAIPGFGEDVLVVHVGGEILDGHHPDYTLVPAEFYQQVVRETGLRPVFMGQTDGNPYAAALREAFPGARWLGSRGPLHDFELIRRSANVVISVSTFSWLAAWLGHAKRIIMPVTGLFHPFQAPRLDLLPLSDPRYEFHLFPIHYAVPVEQVGVAHRGLNGLWRRVSADMIRVMTSALPRYPRRLDAYLAHFDEAHYLGAYSDVATGVEKAHFRSALDHYKRYGFVENREAFPMDRIWYTASYPMAAFELGQGDFVDCHHHFTEVGWSRGYRPRPGVALQERA